MSNNIDEKLRSENDGGEICVSRKNLFQQTILDNFNQVWYVSFLNDGKNNSNLVWLRIFSSVKRLLIGY